MARTVFSPVELFRLTHCRDRFLVEYELNNLLRGEVYASYGGRVYRLSDDRHRAVLLGYSPDREEEAWNLALAAAGCRRGFTGNGVECSRRGVTVSVEEAFAWRFEAANGEVGFVLLGEAAVLVA